MYKNTFITTLQATPEGIEQRTMRAVETPELLPNGCRFKTDDGRITLLGLPITIFETNEDPSAKDAAAQPAAAATAQPPAVAKS